jgi:hypothetical protein
MFDSVLAADPVQPTHPLDTVHPIPRSDFNGLIGAAREGARSPEFLVALTTLVTIGLVLDGAWFASTWLTGDAQALLGATLLLTGGAVRLFSFAVLPLAFGLVVRGIPLRGWSFLRAVVRVLPATVVLLCGMRLFEALGVPEALPLLFLPHVITEIGLKGRRFWSAIFDLSSPPAYFAPTVLVLGFGTLPLWLLAPYTAFGLLFPAFALLRAVVGFTETGTSEALDETLA